MKLLKFFALVFLATSLWGCARRVVVTTQPSPPGEVRPAAPNPNYVWVPGEWIIVNGSYTWRNGYWVAPRPGRIWTPGHWAQTSNGWYWVRGHWS